MDLNTPFDFQESACSRSAYDIRFSYFSADEIRRVSVAEIQFPLSLTKDKALLKHGVHDQAMGPLSEGKKEGEVKTSTCCDTCGLRKDCPGHFGHIELAAALFNPMMFDSLYKLLNKTCIHCCRLKIDAARTADVVHRLNSLKGDKTLTKDDLPVVAKQSALQSKCEPDDEPGTHFVQDLTADGDGDWLLEKTPTRSLKEVTAYVDSLAARCVASRDDAVKDDAAEPGKKTANLPKESGSMEALFKLLESYVKEIPSACQNCEKKLRAAKWKKEGHSLLTVKRPTDPDYCIALPSKVRSILRDLWKQEKAILHWLLPGARESGPEIFFLEAVFVPPNKFRPLTASLSGEDGPPKYAKQTGHIINILQANKAVRDAISNEKANDRAIGKLSHTAAAAIQKLQLHVNNLMDSTKSEEHPRNQIPGVRQLLERKEGLFRMKMMGKRVNFAARSVISPDPNIETSEIGVPLLIAQELMYPEVPAGHNTVYLRELVERGARYPGALEVHIPKANGGKHIVHLKYKTKEEREAIAKQLVTDIESGKPAWTVFRQIKDGDPLLVNRQPTLHKPGIMAHIVKVLKKEKTIRMHYVNCNTYNADFDGDEMNLHAPQEPIGRQEALHIAKADLQYLVPTDGKPLRGLIQDHVVAGVLLTRRDAFFTKEEACLLLYTGLRAAFEGPGIIPGVSVDDEAAGSKPPRKGMPGAADIKIHRQKQRIRLDPPCVLKPAKRWSGKQIFSMLLKNLVRQCLWKKGMPTRNQALRLESKSKTPGDLWNGKMDGNKEEATVQFLDTDLLQGVLDKSQFGAATFGIMHLLFEMLGSNLVGTFFASLARLLTLSLQMRGFSCCYRDLLLRDETEEQRRQLLEDSRDVAKKVGEGWLRDNSRSAGAGASSRMISTAAQGLLDQGLAAEAFEGKMIGAMKENWGKMIDKCIPAGQWLPFPRNCFAAMVHTGAKGSKVNQSQITCCLGQQELEGRLPPLMATMRSLPCFAPYDLSSRTRGYITDRFLTGIRPQEFFFHCMAGREGLVDTAVKTSRSGYLQRCMVKHLESLKVCYDLTVRDSDGSVMQFLYGEDGADVTRSPYLMKFAELRSNYQLVSTEKQRSQLKRLESEGAIDFTTAESYVAALGDARSGNLKTAVKRLKRVLRENTEASGFDNASRTSLEAIRKRLQDGAAEGASAMQDLDPISSVLSPAHFFGSTSEKHEAELQKYLASSKMSTEQAKGFAKCMRLKFMKSLAAPGEAVGVLAAQSMGEPCTQMTLNTFHLAGHGGANVTLGIPRMREIIQTGSQSCATPLMRVPVLRDASGKTDLSSRLRFAQTVVRKFKCPTVLDCVKRVVVHESAKIIQGHIVWNYQCVLDFLPIKELCARVQHLSKERIEAFIRGHVCRKLRTRLKIIIDELRTQSASVVAETKMKKGEEGEVVADDADAGDGEAGNDGPAPKRSRRAIRGAEDKLADQEARDEEAEAEQDDDDDADDKDDASKKSGMYSSESEDENDGAKSGGGEEEDNEDTGKGAEDAKAADADAAEAKADADSSGEESPQKGNAGVTGRDADEETPQGPKKKAAKTAQGGATSSTCTATAQGNLAKALAAGNLVWCSPIENEKLTIVVSYKNETCPHRLYVAEALQEICKGAELPDPSCEGVKKVHVKRENNDVQLECEGINLLGLQSLPDVAVDHKKIWTNNIRSIQMTYGIEAARAAVVREIRAVFGHYGIGVDHRHLALVADYMCQGGSLRPFSRAGMLHCSSPLLQMTYETSTQYLARACKDQVVDSMKSPASAIVLGQPPAVGTGMVSVLVDLNPETPAFKKKQQKGLSFSFSPTA